MRDQLCLQRDSRKGIGEVGTNFFWPSFSAPTLSQGKSHSHCPLGTVPDRCSYLRESGSLWCPEPTVLVIMEEVLGSQVQEKVLLLMLVCHLYYQFLQLVSCFSFSFTCLSRPWCIWPLSYISRTCTVTSCYGPGYIRVSKTDMDPVFVELIVQLGRQILIT